MSDLKKLARSRMIVLSVINVLFVGIVVCLMTAVLVVIGVAL